MNTSDKHFNYLAKDLEGKTIVLSDYGFQDKDGTPENMKFCANSTWNERMGIETAFSMVPNVCNFKKSKHWAAEYIKARLAFATAMFNALLSLFHACHPDAQPFQMSIAESSL